MRILPVFGPTPQWTRGAQGRSVHVLALTAGGFEDRRRVWQSAVTAVIAPVGRCQWLATGANASRRRP